MTLTFADFAKTIRAPLSSEEFASEADSKFLTQRAKFFCPTVKQLPCFDSKSCKVDNPESAEAVYLCGNSLGLQPKRTPEYVCRELTKWAETGVYGHTNGELPWVSCENYPVDMLAHDILGCNPDEVVVMNNLTANIHLLLGSFYKPTAERHKIIIEDHTFPSDHYAVQGQIESHGFDVKNSMILVKPRQGENLIRTADILAAIQEHGPSIALVFLSGVHYFTGQLIDMAKICSATHDVGAICGFDLAHAVGNVPLHLSDWSIDFACFCCYKYLNSGAGTIGACYINRRHFDRQPRLVGWFAHRLETRFKMENVLEVDAGASGFKTGNQSPFLCACLLASLEIFREAGGVEALRERSVLLTGYLEWLLVESPLFSRRTFSIISPSNVDERGCQLSIRVPNPPGADALFEALERYGVVIDHRKPDVLRVTPAPLYNTFTDVYRFAMALKVSLEELHTNI